MIDYRFPTVKKARLRKPTFGQFEQEPEEEVGLIQGRKPGSIQEWRVAKALWRLGLTFNYQASFFGGRMLRGGQILDFLVDTVPIKTALAVNGEYWHSGEMGSEDSFKMAQLENYMLGWGRLVILWGKDLSTQEDANRIVSDKVR